MNGNELVHWDREVKAQSWYRLWRIETGKGYRSAIVVFCTRVDGVFAGRLRRGFMPFLMKRVFSGQNGKSPCFLTLHYGIVTLCHGSNESREIETFQPSLGILDTGFR
jgi:hypothetical protein